MEIEKLKIGDKVRFHFERFNSQTNAQDILTWDSVIHDFIESKDFGKLAIIDGGFHFPCSWIEKVLISK